jgi:dihydroorotase
MGSSTGNLLVDNPVSLENIFKDSPVLIATHCEETPMIIAKEKEFKKRYGDNIPIENHEFIRSREACLASSKKAVDLAKEFNSKLHILHVSTEDELALLTNDNIENKQISAEVCVPHLFFSSDDYLTKGTRIKCNPSIKNISDKIALRKALKSGLIDFVATDHAPHDIILKGNSYFSCPSGMPSIQHTLLAVLQLVRDGDLSLEDVSKVTSHNVATRFNIKDRGYIREGYWADLVLVDLEKEQVINNKNLEYKCGWSPFEGDKFSSTIIETIINGERAYSEGKVIDNIRGKKIEFTRG